MTADHSWMRPVLLALFADYTDHQVREALSREDVRSDLRDDLNRNVLYDGKLGSIPVDTYGDNLVQGLLALRTKFDRETAIAKLDVNLAMRNQRRN